MLRGRRDGNVNDNHWCRYMTCVIRIATTPRGRASGMHTCLLKVLDSMFVWSFLRLNKVVAMIMFFCIINLSII